MGTPVAPPRMVGAHVTGGGGGGGAVLGAGGFPFPRETHAYQAPSVATLSRAKMAFRDSRLGRTKIGMPDCSPGAHQHRGGFYRYHVGVHRSCPQQVRPSRPPSPAHHAPLVDRVPHPYLSPRTRFPHEGAGANAAASCPAPWPHEREIPLPQTSSCSLRSCGSLRGATSPLAFVLAHPTSWQTGPQTDPPLDHLWFPASHRCEHRPRVGALILGTTHCQTRRQSAPHQPAHQKERS